MGLILEDDDDYTPAASPWTSGQRSSTQWAEDDDGDMVLNIGGPAPAPKAKAAPAPARGGSSSRGGDLFRDLF